MKFKLILILFLIFSFIFEGNAEGFSEFNQRIKNETAQQLVGLNVNFLALSTHPKKKKKKTVHKKKKKKKKTVHKKKKKKKKKKPAHKSKRKKK